jgi:hypothetical protein
MQADTRVMHPTDPPEGGGERMPPARRRRAVVAVGVTAVAVLAAALGFALVGGDEDRAARSPTTTSIAPSTAPSTAPPTTPSTSEAEPGAGATATAPTVTARAAAPVLEDGRHPVYLTVLDSAARTVEFDLIEFLTGDAAIAAWDAAHPDEPGGPPNDYVIVNENPRLRVLPLADDVTVTVTSFDGGGLRAQPIPFADLPARLAGNPMPGEGRLWPNPFWLTVENGTVTAMDEQYIP